MTADTHAIAEALRDVRARTIGDRKLLDAAADELDRLAAQRQLLPVAIADCLRGALDACRIQLGPRTERALIEHICEELVLRGYSLTVAEPDPPAPDVELEPKVW